MVQLRLLCKYVFNLFVLNGVQAIPTGDKKSRFDIAILGDDSKLGIVSICDETCVLHSFCIFHAKVASVVYRGRAAYVIK